jgi:protein-S-isoprenylcysteine O-methyltransferase Ste14
MDIEALAHAALRPTLMLGWLAFGLAFATRERGGASGTARRDAQGWIGFAIQAVGFFATWSLQRPADQALLPGLPWTVTAFVTLLLVTIGAGLVFGAVRALGKQWSLAARTRSDHELVTTGPYAIVRNPIYTALLAMLLASGIALSDLRALAVGLVVYLIGTHVRVRAEERVLRATFGAAFDAYAARVPALLPRLGRG